MALLFGVHGEDGVGDRHAGFQLHIEDAACGFVRDHFEMVGVAAHHGAERDERIVFLGQREFLQRQRMFQRTGHVDQQYVITGHAQPQQFRFAGRQQTLADVPVEAAHDDAEFQALPLVGGVEFGEIVLVGSHGASFFQWLMLFRNSR